MGKQTQKKATCKQSIRPKQEDRFLSSQERSSRNASLVSVVFGVDRDQVFGVAVRTLPVLLLLLLLMLLREVRSVAAAFVVGSSRRKPQKTRKQVLNCVRTHKLMQSYRLGKVLEAITGSIKTCTPWSRQLVTGDWATRARGSSRRYQLLPSWYHPYIILLLLLSPPYCVGWCVRSRSSRA